MKTPMKTLYKFGVAIFASIVVFTLGLSTPNAVFAATDPGLGAAATFSIVAQTAITGTGTISGDVGINSTGAGITALTAINVGGVIYSADGVAPGLAILDPAVQADLSAADLNISGQGSDGSIGPALDGLTLTTGVYDIGAGRLNGGVLTLDGPGIYIFRASSDFISSGSIDLTNGARACDVYWQVDTLATINGSSFVGTIIAGTGIHFGDSVALDGRALALGGDVTLLNNTISGPTCATPPPPPDTGEGPRREGTINVVKKVINDNGGTKGVADFQLFVNDTPVVSGATNIFPAPALVYTVTETLDANYTRTFSGDCDVNGQINIVPGDNRFCIVTNDDIAAVIPPPVVVVPPPVVIPPPVVVPPPIVTIPGEVLGTSTPGLPETGSAPFPWNIVLFTGLTGIMALYFTIVFLREPTL